MPSPPEKKEYKPMRDKGKEALSTVLREEKNIAIFEKYINKKARKVMKAAPERSIKVYEKAYRRIALQVIGDIKKGNNLNALLKDIKKDMIGWEHPQYADVKARIEEHDEFIINPFEVEEGVTECGKCGSKRVFTYQKQCRSGDESATTFAECVQCKANWSYSG